MKSLIQAITGRAISDSNWEAECPNCGNYLEIEGYFDSSDEYNCTKCAEKFTIKRIIFDDGSYLEE